MRHVEPLRCDMQNPHSEHRENDKFPEGHGENAGENEKGFRTQKRKLQLTFRGKSF